MFFVFLVGSGDGIVNAWNIRSSKEVCPDLCHDNATFNMLLYFIVNSGFIVHYSFPINSFDPLSQYIRRKHLKTICDITGLIVFIEANIEELIWIVGDN